MASYPPIVVGGSTTADINIAITAAGPGGKLIFPANTWTVDGLQHTVAHQTWEFDSNATLQRSSTSTAALLTLNAAGLKIRGGTFDGNAANTAGGDILDLGTDLSGNTVSNDLDIENATLMNGLKWGIFGYSSPLRVNRCNFSNIRWGEIRWTHPFLTAVQAAEITDNVIDKSMITNVDTGSVYVWASNSHNYQLGLGPKIYRNKIVQPGPAGVAPANLFQGKYVPSTIPGILLGGCQNGFVCDNIIIGGGNGMSLDNNQYCQFTGNRFQVTGTYSIELGGNDNLIAGNKGSGLGPSYYGLFVNSVVTGSQCADNHFPIGYDQGGIVNQAGSGCNMVNNW